MLVSVIIKCLNEEQRIAQAIESAISALEGIAGEVIVADSCSSDRTIEIAQQYPIKIVQLAKPEQRCCGIGPQLGFQIAQGEFIYILDGDMELNADFMQEALQRMQDTPTLAGIAGQVDEQSSASYQFRGRQRRESSLFGPMQWLDMGGLYRRKAIEQSGYLSNRNLHAYEEMDLGLRLTADGWGLERIKQISVKHYGWTDESITLLKRRWQNHYIDGSGDILKASVGKKYFKQVVKAQKHIFVGLGVWAMLIASLLCLSVSVLPLVVLLLFVAVLVLIRMRRTGSLKDALFGQLVWQVTALAALRGFFAKQVDPCDPVDHVLIAPVETTNKQ